MSTKKQDGRGRPRVADPKVPTHVAMRKSQRGMCNAAADSQGLAFSPWACSVLVAEARRILQVVGKAD